MRSVRDRLTLCTVKARSPDLMRDYGGADRLLRSCGRTSAGTGLVQGHFLCALVATRLSFWSAAEQADALMTLN